MNLRPLLRHPLAWLLAIALVIAGAFTAAWRYTALSEYASAENVLSWAEQLSSHPWAPFVLALSYTPASIVMFPRPLLTLAAVVAFGPWEGFVVAMGGVIVKTLVFYYAGRAIGRDKLARWGGPRMERLGRLLRKDGLVAVVTVGLLPVAPFLLEVLTFGALRMKLRHVVPGVMLAMLPGMVGTILLGDQVAAALAHDRSINRGIIAGVILAMAALLWFTRRWWKKVQAAIA